MGGKEKSGKERSWKERISLTIDNDLLKRLDATVDGKRIRTRSQAFEVFLTKGIEAQAITKAVVLCGGAGTRLKPITYEMPKPMVPVRDKPILEYIINHLHKHGITEIILAVGYKHEKIISYFGNGSKFGVNLHYIIEEKSLGTAGCLKLAKDMLTGTFVLMYGDVLSKVDFNDMLQTHRRNDALATIALTTTDQPSEYGVVKLRGDQIVKFVEKPKKGTAPTNLINAGVFILEPKFINLVDFRNGRVMIERVFEKFADGDKGKIAGYVYDGPWFDMETMKKYEQAIKGWKE